LYYLNLSPQEIRTPHIKKDLSNPQKRAEKILRNMITNNCHYYMYIQYCNNLPVIYIIDIPLINDQKKGISKTYIKTQKEHSRTSARLNHDVP